jgi:hypothetical protein
MTLVKQHSFRPGSMELQILLNIAFTQLLGVHLQTELGLRSASKAQAIEEVVAASYLSTRISGGQSSDRN